MHSELNVLLLILLCCNMLPTAPRVFFLVISKLEISIVMSSLFRFMATNGNHLPGIQNAWRWVARSAFAGFLFRVYCHSLITFTSLKLTASLHLKIGLNAPKGKDRIPFPSIFRCEPAVSFREGTQDGPLLYR